MKKTVKWGSAAAAVVLLGVSSYYLARPAAVRYIEPLLEEAAAAEINGTVTWKSVDLDASYNLELTDVVLKDAKGEDVLRAPSLTVGWTVGRAISSWQSGKGAAGVISEVFLDAPSFQLIRYEDGSWNVQNLLKPKAEEKPNAFSGRILLRKGTAAILMGQGERQVLHQLGGQFSWMNPGRIEARLEGDFKESPFHAVMSYVDENNFEGELSAGALPLTLVRPFFKDLPDSVSHLAITGGEAVLSSGKVWRHDGVLAYHVKGHANHISANLDKYSLRDGSVDFDVYDKSARISNARGFLNDALLTGSGSITWGDDVAVDSRIELHHGDLAKLVPDEDLKGDVSGFVRLTGPVSALHASGHASLAGGSVQGMAVDRAKADFSWDGDTVTLEEVSAALPDGEISGSGMYTSSTGYFSGMGEALRMPLSLLGVPVLSGTVTGSGSAAGYWHEGNVSLSSLEASGSIRDGSYQNYSAKALSGGLVYDGNQYKARVYGEGVSDGSLTVDSVSGEAEGTGDRWTVNYLNGTLGDGAFSLRGTCGKDAVDLSLQAGGIDVTPFGAYIGEPVSGIVSLSGKVAGPLSAPAADLTLSLHDGSFRSARIKQLSGHVVSDGEWLTLSDMKMETDTGAHTLSGRIGLGGPHSLDLYETSRHTRIENILHLAGLDTPVTGWINNETYIRGTLDNPQISGRFLAWDGSVAGELFQSASADYTLKDRELLISNGLSYIYGGAATASGTVAMDRLDLDVSLVDVSADRMARTLPVKGKATLRGHVSGRIDNPSFDGYAESRSITIGKASVERLSAGLHYQDHVFEIKDGYFRQRSGKFQGSGLIHADTGVLSGKVLFQEWDLGEAVKLFDLPVQNIKGSMNGGLVLEGSLDNPNVSLDVRLNGGNLGEVPMGEGRVDMSYMNHQLSIRDFHLPIGTGLLAAKGTMDGEGNLDMAVAASGMDLSWIPSVTGLKNTAIGGKLTAGMTLRGSREDPSADISVTIDHPSYNGIDFDSLSLMGNVSDSSFRIDQALVTKGIYKATASGVVPAAVLTRVPTEKNVPFNVDLNLDNADLNALVLFAKPVTSASGPIRGHVKITGDWDDPHADGTVRVDQGTVTLNTLSEPLSGISGRLDFTGKHMALEGAAAVGGGSISAAGILTWDQTRLTSYSGEAHIHAPKLNSVYYKGAIDADFTAQEERGLPKISGNVNIRDATIDIPMSLEESSGGPDVLMDVNVALGDRVRLYNSLLYDMNVRGNIHAMGLLSRPVMSGRVDVEKGMVKYLSNEFNVTEGTAVWGGVPDSFLPVLSLKANTSVGHYKVNMDLKGPPGAFRLHLSSEPALSDSQIVTLLTLRQAPGTDNDETTGALFNAGLQMAFSGGVQNFLKDSFGLDVLSVTTSLTDYYDSSAGSANDDYYYIKIGKYLFNNFMLTATTGINNSQQSIGFRYDLKSRVGLAAWYNSDHDSYIGADYQFRF